MDDCVALARTLGERIGRELHIPVYLYERAATRPDRENLADVRTRRVRGPARGDSNRLAARTRLRSAGSAPERGRRRSRCAPVSRRLQCLPRAVEQPRRRQRGRQGGARILRRSALCQGARPRRRRTGTGIDEPGGHRPDTAVPGVRGSAPEAAAHGVIADLERDRRTRARTCAARCRRPTRAAPRLHDRPAARAQDSVGGRAGTTLACLPRGRRRADADTRWRKRRRTCGRPRRGTRSDGRRAHGRPAQVRSSRRGDARLSHEQASTLGALLSGARRSGRRRLRCCRRRVQAAEGAGDRGRGPARRDRRRDDRRDDGPARYGARVRPSGRVGGSSGKPGQPQRRLGRGRFCAAGRGRDPGSRLQRPHQCRRPRRPDARRSRSRPKPSALVLAVRQTAARATAEVEKRI